MHANHSGKRAITPSLHLTPPGTICDRATKDLVANPLCFFVLSFPLFQSISHGHAASVVCGCRRCRESGRNHSDHAMTITPPTGPIVASQGRSSLASTLCYGYSQFIHACRLQLRTQTRAQHLTLRDCTAYRTNT